ncbi:MAG: formylglycine-generating enzyme family protein [Magnetococcus sp. DMHC-6]
MAFVWVPKGCFKMGSPESEKNRHEDEGPLHEVCLEGYWLGKYEVTNRQFRHWRKDHPDYKYKDHSLNGDDQPVVNVDWNDANDYAQWLTAQGRGTFRLPTEAEWEYAARANTNTVRFWGDGESEACRYANVVTPAAKREFSFTWDTFPCEDNYKTTAPVGKFLPNAFGLYDMLGNVWEWVSDWYGEKYYATSARDNPQGPALGPGRVVRGGSWYILPSIVRSAARDGIDPGYRFVILGFRLVRQP